MKTAPYNINSNNLRTLESLKTDLDRYKSLGSDPKVAKQCNNVIDDVYFDIKLDQVRPGKKK